MNKIVAEDKLEKAYHLKAYEMSSCIFGMNPVNLKTINAGRDPGFYD